jgi:hypothetical protein
VPTFHILRHTVSQARGYDLLPKYLCIDSPASAPGGPELTLYPHLRAMHILTRLLRQEVWSASLTRIPSMNIEMQSSLISFRTALVCHPKLASRACGQLPQTCVMEVMAIPRYPPTSLFILFTFHRRFFQYTLNFCIVTSISWISCRYNRPQLFGIEPWSSSTVNFKSEEHLSALLPSSEFANMGPRAGLRKPLEGNNCRFQRLSKVETRQLNGSPPPAQARDEP